MTSDGSLSSVTTADESSKLIWLKDPCDNFSDWSIEIVCKHENVHEALEETTKYRVHQLVLGCDIYGSEYFKRLFRNKHFREAESFNSRIELDPLAANAFPLLLDFVYRPEHKLLIDANTATSLHFLGDYFEIPRLQQEALQFISHDMTFGNVVTYYTHAMALSNSVVHEMVVMFLTTNIQDGLPSTWETLTKMSCSSLWKDVSVAVDSRDKDACCALSNRICQFAMHHRGKLDALTFQDLIKEESMKWVCPCAAFGLWDLAKTICWQESTSSTDEEPTAQEISLKERCMAAWLEDPVVVEKLLAAETVAIDFKRNHPHFLVEVLVKALAKANTTAAKFKQDHELTQAALERDKAELVRAKYDEENTKAELGNTKAELQAKVSIIQRFVLCGSGEKNDFVRVNNGYPKNLPEEMYDANPNLRKQFGVYYYACKLNWGRQAPVFYLKD